MLLLNNDWSPIMEAQLEQSYYMQLRQFLIGEYRDKVIYPSMNEIYAALHLTPYYKTKVVILGQDPYHAPGQAHGLSFSVKPGVKKPPTLHNIFRELHTDLGCTVPDNGYLVKWAEQGVLLLNSVLTVREGSPNSHRDKGWEIFTNHLIRALNLRDKPLVFILWGKPAQEKGRWIDEGRHLVIQSVHPSPLAAYKGFFGSKPFSKANEFLRNIGSKPIDWQIPDISS